MVFYLPVNVNNLGRFSFSHMRSLRMVHVHPQPTSMIKFELLMTSGSEDVGFINWMCLRFSVDARIGEEVAVVGVRNTYPNH